VRRIAWLARSLEVRTVAVMLLAILVVHGGALLFYRQSAAAAADAAFAKQVANQISLAREAVMRRDPSDREEEAKALSSPHFEFGWSSGRSRPRPAVDPTLASFRDQMVAVEPALAPGLVLEMDAGEDPLHRSELAGTSELPDGSVLTFRSAHAPDIPRANPGAFLSTLMAILVGVTAVVLMHWTAAPLRDLARFTGRIGRGAPVSVPEAGPDEIRGIARALNAMQERIHGLVTERTQALAAVSHDLRTPISRLRLRLDGLADATEAKAMAADLDDMQAMVDATLAYLHGDADPEPRQATNVASILMGISDASADAGRDVEYGGPGRAIATVRPVAFKRALENLVDNGVRYGTRVWISLEIEESALLVTVEDEGPGIAAGDVARAFEPFTRLEGSRNRNSGGTGLGLTIAKRAIEADGGTLDLSNRREGGLCAEIRLPRALPGS
jgi:signal transduction histidine kinase